MPPWTRPISCEPYKDSRQIRCVGPGVPPACVVNLLVGKVTVHPDAPACQMNCHGGKQEVRKTVLARSDTRRSVRRLPCFSARPVLCSMERSTARRPGARAQDWPRRREYPLEESNLLLEFRRFSCGPSHSGGNGGAGGEPFPRPRHPSGDSEPPARRPVRPESWDHVRGPFYPTGA